MVRRAKRIILHRLNIPTPAWNQVQDADNRASLSCRARSEGVPSDLVAMLVGHIDHVGHKNSLLKNWLSFYEKPLHLLRANIVAG